MKKLLIVSLIFGIGLGFNACSKKEESPDPVRKGDTTNNNPNPNPGGGGNNPPNLTAASDIQFWGEIDGTVVTYKVGSTYAAAYDKDSTTGPDSTTSWYHAGLVDPSTFGGISATRGKITFPNNTTPSGPLFGSLFSAGMYNYGDDITEITFLENALSIWSTAEGDQTGSTFQITELSSTGVTAAPKYKVVMKFNCKVYNAFNPTQSKEIKNGILVAEFIAQ